MLNGNRTKSERKRSPRDFYATPTELAKAALAAFHDSEHDSISYNTRWLDAGCGTGVWGNAFNDSANILIGIDIAPTFNANYSRIITGDFLKYDDEYGFDVVFGNPPYSLAEEFVRHAYELIGLNDYIFFLLRLSFLEGIKRGRGLFKDIPLKRVYVFSRRPSFFTTNGKHTTDTLSYGMFLWQKGFRGQPTISFLDWDYDKTI